NLRRMRCRRPLLVGPMVTRARLPGRSQAGGCSSERRMVVATPAEHAHAATGPADNTNSGTLAHTNRAAFVPPFLYVRWDFRVFEFEINWMPAQPANHRLDLEQRLHG